MNFRKPCPDFKPLTAAHSGIIFKFLTSLLIFQIIQRHMYEIQIRLLKHLQVFRLLSVVSETQLDVR